MVELQITSNAESDTINVDLADQLWTQVLNHCQNNMDGTIISKGVNEKGNLFYGRYYEQYNEQGWRRPPLQIMDERLFVNKDVYFVRSTDLLSAKNMPFFAVCVVFVKSGDEVTIKGSYSSVVGDHPSICVFVQEHVRYMTNWQMVQTAFKRLDYNPFYRSTFVHEFTHLQDDKKYDIAKQHKHIQSPQEYERLCYYFNLNHEVNARYMQFIHEILSIIDNVPGVQQHGIGRTFPVFQSFLNAFWDKTETSKIMLDYLSKENKKRLLSRLYQFYRYLIEQEVKHSLMDAQAEEFAQNQVLSE